MRTYVRTRAKGGTYCFTVNLAERHGNTLLVDHIELLKQAFRQTRLERPFTMPGFVILPEHLHCLWTLPEGDHDFPTRWRLIKSRFSRALDQGERRSASRLRKNERGIWQRRYWEHLVRDDADFRRCLDYIHYNPVKHGHTDRVMDWPHSSFRNWVKQGVYPADWAAPVGIESMQWE